MTAVRSLWHRLEAINAVTYFAPECRQAMADVGLRGFWMGYFAGRAAPMGPVAPAVVEATFFNFHPSRVRRAIPDAWSLATAERIVDTRARGAASALRRLLGDDTAEAAARATLGRLHAAVDQDSGAGLALFSANRAVPARPDVVEAWWQAATTLREHRGDGHVAVLVSHGIGGCDAHVLFAAATSTAAQLYLDSRAWSEDEWAEARARLTARGLLTASGELTAAGRVITDDIETTTDALAARAFDGIDVPALVRDLDGPARRVLEADEVPFPNAMGLPRLADWG